MYDKKLIVEIFIEDLGKESGGEIEDAVTTRREG